MEDKLKKYIVWIDQVNQCHLEIEAKNKGDAILKGYKKWRRSYMSHSRVSYVEEKNKN